MFLGLPDPDPLARGMDPDPSLFHKGVDLTAILFAKKMLHKIIFLLFKIKDNVPAGSGSLTSLKKGVRSGRELDPDQNVTDPQHWDPH